MLITTDLQRRTLQFVLAANRGGYQPSSKEVREWVDRPDPRPGKRGKMIRPARPAKPGIPSPFMQSLTASIESPVLRFLRENQQTYATPSIDFASTFGKDFRAAAGIASMFGGTAPTPGRPARYAPDGPPEHVVKQLVRFGWMQKGSNKGLTVTPLGRALLNSDESKEAGVDETGVLVLQSRDPLAWGKLVGSISELEEVYIVDPYLRAEQLVQLVEHADVHRVLIGPKIGKSAVTELKVLLATPGYESLAVRQAPHDMLHDRYIVDPLSVRMLGASMNGVGGAATTVVFPLPDEHGAYFRQRAEEWWEGSEDLRSSPAT
ncbi:putative uncharacterized protein [Rhodococcus sp. AW25M09]|nr:putative uncharacterized protein [Rhodococcus sp. AW25M09]